MTDDLRNELALVLAKMAKDGHPASWAYEFQVSDQRAWVTVVERYKTSWLAGDAAGMHLRLFPDHTVRLKRIE